MTSTSEQAGEIRIVGTSVGQVLFALSMVWLGVLGFQSGKFSQIWQPAPKWVPAQTVLAYLCAFISVASGTGLLLRRRTAAIAARVIFAAFLVWLVVMRLPNLFYEKPVVLVAWSCGATAVMLAGAWLLYVRLTGEGDGQRLGLFAGPAGVRTARVLFGLSLIPFGLAHLMYLDATAPLIPNWLPWHTALANVTGATFIAAGLAIVVGVMPGIAAALATLQIGLFSVIVWVPRVISGNLTEFQRGEVVSTWVLMAGAWVVAESYRGANAPAQKG